ncbi:MAG: DUF2812 domain-containing protein [Clostridiales bacterium]|nr:DUF2812 domain-containing protein [Clostridiales bacterium]
MLKRVIKPYSDFEKEEIWLNKMVAKGYALSKYNFMTYHFERCNPGDYTYRIEFLDQLPSHPDSQEYIEFVKDLGVEYVDSYFRWVYFRKKTELGPFEIHSDSESRIKHYKSIMRLQGLIALMSLSISFSNISIGSISHTNQYIGFMNLTLAVLLGWSCYKNYRKIKQLKNQNILHE